MITPRIADRLIRNGRPVTVTNERYRETFTTTFVKRDKYSIYSADGGVYDRKELTIAQTH